MIINKIYISAFGKLTDKTIEFKPDCNIIYGENECGKSTVMAFIKMMFYGGKKASQQSLSIREKYLPWKEGVFGGRIFFEFSGKNYCLERQFRKSDSTDRITLTDTDTGETLSADQNIGIKFFGMGASAFERSVFIGQSGILSHDETAEGELNSKLSNLVLTGDENVSYQKVIKRLEDAKLKLISKTGKSGQFAKDKQKFDELNLSLEDSLRTAKERTELNEEINSLQKQKGSLLKKQEEYKKILETREDIKNTEKLKLYLEKKQELDGICEKSVLKDGSTADEIFVKKADFCINRYEERKNRISELEKEIADLKNRISQLESSNKENLSLELERLNEKAEEINKERKSAEEKAEELNGKIAELTEQKKESLNKKKPFNPVLLILGAVVLVFGAVLVFIQSKTVGAVVSALGIIFFILGFIIKPKDIAYINLLSEKLEDLKNQSENIRSKKSDLQEKSIDLGVKINNISALLNSDEAIIAERKQNLDAALNKLSEEKEKAQAVFDDFKEIAERIGEEDIGLLKEKLVLLKENAEKIKEIKLNLGYLSSDLKGISYEQARQKLASQENKSDLADNTDFEAIKENAEKISSQITEIASLIAEKQAELKSKIRNFTEPDTIKREISLLNESLNAQKEFCLAAQTAQEILTESFSQVRRGYGSALEKKTLEIFSKLTSGRYTSLTVSKNLDIKAENSSDFGMRELEYLSSGTVDQAYLSLRLALSSLMAGEETMPIMLDDPFAQYDDERAKKALAFLSEYSKDTQTIMFTCHNFVCEMAKEQKIEIKNL